MTDAEAAAGRLRAAGYVVDTGKSRFIAADPWGTRVRLAVA
jgi:hypothetical protein